MLAPAVALASSSPNASARAAALAAAVLAARKSDPAVRGRMLVKRSSKVSKAGIPAPPLAAPATPAGSRSQPRPAEAAPVSSAAAPAPLTGTSSDLLRPKAVGTAVLARPPAATAPLGCVLVPLASTPCAPLALDKTPRPSSPNAPATDVLDPVPADQLRCCPSAPLSVQVVAEPPGSKLARCPSASMMTSSSETTASVAASSHVADLAVSPVLEDPLPPAAPAGVSSGLPSGSCSQPQSAVPWGTLALLALLVEDPPLPPRFGSFDERIPDTLSTEELLPMLGSDPAVVMEGLGSLSLPSAASGGLDFAEVSSVKDVDDDEELAPQVPMTSTKGVVSGSARGSTDVCYVEEAIGDEEDWVQVGRGGRPARAPLSPLREEGHGHSLAFKRWARGRCFRCLERGHQVSTCRGPFRCIRCRRPGHRERFCRARSPAARSRSPDARAHSPDARAPCQRSRLPSAQPRCPSSSLAEVVCHSSLCPAVQPRPSPGCCEEFSDSTFQSRFALLRLELCQLVADRIEEVSRPLREEVATLKLLLAGVDGPSHPAKACDSDGLGLTQGEDLFPLDSAEEQSSVVEEALHYGCFSPRGSSCPSTQFVATSAPVSEDRGALDFEESGVVDGVASLSPESIGSVVPVGGVVATSESPLVDEVDKTGVLTSNSETLFGKEICDLLVDLEAALPGYGKEIASVLAGTAPECVIKKVEKSLKKTRRIGVFRVSGVA